MRADRVGPEGGPQGGPQSAFRGRWGADRRSALLLLMFLGGCCHFAKRDCFPPCPPPQVVEVAKPCDLPEPTVLEPFKRAECPGQPTLACFTAPEAAKLAGNLEALKTWVQRARARCGKPPASAPATSAPASKPSR